MSRMSADVLICGAGIAGVSTAYHLGVNAGVKSVVLVDERSPLSLTSDKSTECYRNWWPGPDGVMVRLMNRSIDLLEALAEKSGNVFHMNRRGYVFATTKPDRVAAYRKAGGLAAKYGAGPLRLHPGERPYQPAVPEDFHAQPDGADLIRDPALIQAHFPYLSPQTIGVLHIRRAGWLSAQQLGMFMLAEAQNAGVQVWRDQVEQVRVQGGRVQAIRLAASGWVETSTFVNAAGPFIRPVGQMVAVDLPVFTELHLKVALRDHQRVLPREVPMLIWGDPQHLNWSPDERRSLDQSPETRWLVDPFPAGVHTRPEGGPGSETILLLWEYQSHPVDPRFPIPLDPVYPELVLRGLSAMIPGMETYLSRMPKPMVDGGYYTKTRENRPLAGPLGVEGAYILGALSGFGIMAAPGLGELLAAHILGEQLPEYAPAFGLERYEDSQYQALLGDWGESWQL